MSDGSNMPSKKFYWIASAALFWNLFGITVYVDQVTLSNEALSALPEAQRVFYENTPAWATAAFAMAVNAGALGCLLLLLRKAWALPVFVLSLACVLIQVTYNTILSNGLEVFGRVSLAAPVSIIIIGAYLIKFSIDAKNKGWIS